MKLITEFIYKAKKKYYRGEGVVRGKQRFAKRYFITFSGFYF